MMQGGIINAQAPGAGVGRCIALIRGGPVYLRVIEARRAALFRALPKPLSKSHQVTARRDLVTPEQRASIMREVFGRDDSAVPDAAQIGAGKRMNHGGQWLRPAQGHAAPRKNGSRRHAGHVAIICPSKIPIWSSNSTLLAALLSSNLQMATVKAFFIKKNWLP